MLRAASNPISVSGTISSAEKTAPSAITAIGVPTVTTTVTRGTGSMSGGGMGGGLKRLDPKLGEPYLIRERQEGPQVTVEPEIEMEQVR